MGTSESRREPKRSNESLGLAVMGTQGVLNSTLLDQIRAIVFGPQVPDRCVQGDFGVHR